jgi:hypothetical protein
VPEELLALKLVLAGYEATRVFVPVVVGVKLQVPVLTPPAPAVSAPWQESPVPSLTVTVPVGATALPEVFATVKFTATGWSAIPLELFAGLVMVVEVFAAVTVTVSEQALFAVLFSVTTLLGFTRQVPPVGLTKVPAALGVAVNCTVKLVPLGMVTGWPAAMHESVLVAMPQLM